MDKIAGTIKLAAEALKIEKRQADAAEALIDAAAILAVEINMDLTNLHERLASTAETMRLANDYVASGGNQRKN